MIGQAILVGVAVYTVVMVIGLALVSRSGPGKLAVFSLATVVACVSAFMAISIMLGRALDSGS